MRISFRPRTFIIDVTTLLAVICSGLLGSFQAANAASAITGFSFNVTQGPTANCADTGLGTMIHYTFVVQGTADGTGFSTVTKLIGVNKTLTYTDNFSDATLGSSVAGSQSNASGFTNTSDSPSMTIDVIANGVNYGGVVVHFNCPANSYSVAYTFGSGSSPSSKVVTDGYIVKLIVITPSNTASAQAQIDAILAQGFTIIDKQQINDIIYVTLRRQSHNPPPGMLN